jgi:hypothetical protein
MELYLSETKIADFIYSELIRKAYVPSSDEVLDLAEIVFDYIITFLLENNLAIVELHSEEEGE